MPLPLPNLDDRRWLDLVEEGRALIPRYAPGWTDHNAHDPGITLMELLAWLVERDLYRVNRIPIRHRLKFLKLIGFSPLPPRPAQAPLTFALSRDVAAASLPAGIALAPGKGSAAFLPFRTQAPLAVVQAQVQTVQSFDGSRFVDRSALWRARQPFPMLGCSPLLPEKPDPERQPAFYIGLDRPLSTDAATSLWLSFGSGRSGQTERERILAEARDQADASRPRRPSRVCPPPMPTTTDWCGPEAADEQETTGAAGEQPAVQTMPPHHSVRLTWEVHTAAGWQALRSRADAVVPGAGDVVDETRGLTLDGAVRIRPASPMTVSAHGDLDAGCYYLRCRLESGLPDAAPLLLDVAINSVLAEQTVPVHGTIGIAAGVTPTGLAPLAGQVSRLRFHLDPTGMIDRDLAFDPAGEAPEVLVLDYQKAGATVPGTLAVTMALIGWGTGQAHQSVTLPAWPAANGHVEIWTAGDQGMQRWRQRRDLDASARTDADFVPGDGAITFGDGERGRVVPGGDAILAVYDVTAASVGNVAADASWSLDGVDDLLNEAMLSARPRDVAAQLQSITNRAAATGGSDEEDPDHATGRAAAALWAHERLLELCSAGSCATLDQLERAEVESRLAPSHATTLLDFERLALDVPGTQVARARAWAGIDPSYPCFSVPGTVTVVIVPWLPERRPQPTRGLRRAVQCYLDRRRTIGTRLVVAGPQYVEASVRTVVRVRAGTDRARTQDAIAAALDAFLDPLRGGPAGRGWPFGRDVYRTEILEVIAQVPGVEYVPVLELIPGSGEAQCGNLCVGPLELVTPGRHTIEVRSGDESWQGHGKLPCNGSDTKNDKG